MENVFFKVLMRQEQDYKSSRRFQSMPKEVRKTQAGVFVPSLFRCARGSTCRPGRCADRLLFEIPPTSDLWSIRPGA